MLRSGGILCLWTSSLVWLSGGRGRAKDFLTPIKTVQETINLAQGVIPAQVSLASQPLSSWVGKVGKIWNCEWNMFDTGTRPRLCLLKAHAWSDGLSEELVLFHHHIAVYLAVQTQIPTELHGAYVSSWYKGVPGAAQHSVCSAS